MSGSRKGQERLQRGVRKLLGVMYMFVILIIVIISWIYSCQTYQIVHFKYMLFLICQLYLRKELKNLTQPYTFFKKVDFTECKLYLKKYAT